MKKKLEILSAAIQKMKTEIPNKIFEIIEILMIKVSIIGIISNNWTFCYRNSLDSNELNYNVSWRYYLCGVSHKNVMNIRINGIRSISVPIAWVFDFWCLIEDFCSNWLMNRVEIPFLTFLVNVHSSDLTQLFNGFNSRCTSQTKCCCRLLMID